MKVYLRVHAPRQAGFALIFIIAFAALALALLATAINWGGTTMKLNARAGDYSRAAAAAEASTEKVLTLITAHYEAGGLALVNSNVDTYRNLVPLPAESGYWTGWSFNDAQGGAGQTYVEIGTNTTYKDVNSAYVGLKGFVTDCFVVSNARQTNSAMNVVAGVRQEVQLTRIPVFQFAMFSAGDMEIGCGQPFAITGRVHANGELYVQPLSTLTFQSDVTAVGDIHFARHPLDTRPAPTGTVTYNAQHDSHVASLNLPIGTENTSDAVREILHPPLDSEDPNSLLGRLRYFNLADMIVRVSNDTVQAFSGRFNNFSTAIPTNETMTFLSTNASFWDAREEKTVLPLDIDVGALAQWSATNGNLRAALGGRDVNAIYVVDRRVTAGNELAAVRVHNGTVLPSMGLTLATARPLYVQGHFNQPNPAYLGTAVTWPSKPSSLCADAITILSGNWSDTNSSASVGSRLATPTTINAAFLTGDVATTAAGYGGGMENYPRFLETWGLANPLNYNGSMVLLFRSLYATNIYGKPNVYDPPRRDWTYDANFNDQAKLPPHTPGLSKVIRSRWSTVAPNSTVAITAP